MDRLPTDPPGPSQKDLYGETIELHPWEKCDVDGCEADVDAYIFSPGHTEGQKYCYPHYSQVKDAQQKVKDAQQSA